MLSAYGLRYSVDNKKDYIKLFWKKRGTTLLVPYFIINIISVIINPSHSLIKNIIRALGITKNFITVFISMYIIFWVCYRFVKKEKIRDYIICLIVLLYSVIGSYFEFQGWCVETLGFLYGVLIYHIKNQLVKMDKIKYLIVYGLMSIILGIIYIKYKEIYMIGTWL